MTKNIYIIAGEPSGDALGGKLIQALKQQSKDELNFHGVGGTRMEEEGFESLFPMSELSIMGFVELIPHIPHMLKRINQTVADILAKKPDVVITIDSPGFCFRVAKKLQESGIRLVHYVAPTVWAYKPKRAAKIAALYDELLVLLPFEPPYFEKEGLKTHFVGHPIVEDVALLGDKATFIDAYHVKKDAKILTMLTGSRKTETKLLLPIYKQVIERLAPQFDALHIILPTIPALEDEITAFAKSLHVPTTVLLDKQEKWHAYAASDVALAKSGTVTLEIALAELPMVITYKVNRFSAWLIRRMIQIEFACLINLLQNKMVIPECLQEECNAERLTREVSELLTNPEHAATQKFESKTALMKLGLAEEITPSHKAAQAILKGI